MNKYRSPDGDDIRVETNTGHITIVGADWRELPAIYHNAAIAAGCECDASTLKRNKVKPEASSEAQKDLDEAGKIKRALQTMLGREVEGDFKSNGDPNLNIVSQLAGFKVKRADVQPVYQELLDEADEEGGGDQGDGNDD